MRIAEALMNGFKLRRLAMLMEPELGNPQEIEGSRDWLRREITRASALREYGSMKPAIRQASSGSASHWNLKPIMSGSSTAVAAARIPALRLWNRFSAT